MYSNLRMPYTRLLSAPGMGDLENLHMITALHQLQNDEFEPAPDTEPHTSTGEKTMSRMIHTVREVAVPAAIFASFFALPMYSYAAIVS